MFFGELKESSEFRIEPHKQGKSHEMIHFEKSWIKVSNSRIKTVERAELDGTGTSWERRHLHRWK